MLTKSVGESQKIIRAALYTRVSGDEQVQHGYGLEIQEQALRQYANTHGYQVDSNHIYVEEGEMGATKDRPELMRMFEDAGEGKFDVLLVWKIDRFFRKVLYLLEGVEMLDACGVKFTSITQPFDTTQPFGMAMLQMMGVIAELERDLIRERTSSGILMTMKKGKW